VAHRDGPGYQKRVTTTPARSGKTPARGGNQYLAALGRPGALRFSAAGFIGRLQIAMFGLGTVLLISSFTGRYGPAGLVSAAGAAGYALVSPLMARLADQ
jgi:hypothetical protein